MRRAAPLLVLALLAGCAGAPRVHVPAAITTEVMREVAHEHLVEAIRGPERVRVVTYDWRHCR